MKVTTVNDVLMNCLSTDSYRLCLTGIWEDKSDKGTYWVATDTHRLAFAKMQTRGDSRYVFPFHLSMMSVPPKFPDWRRIIPKDTPFVFTLPIDSLIFALKTVSIVSKKNGNRVRLKFEDDACFITAQTGDGLNASVKIPALGATKEPYEVAFNYRYMLDMLPEKRDKKFTQVQMAIGGNKTPAVFTYVTEGEFSDLTVIIMPMAME